MMDRKIKGKTQVHGLGLPAATSANFAEPIGPPTIPGPLIEAKIGDTIVVNFRNKVDAPVTIHPHGIFYAQEMDGAYKGKYTDPGGFVQREPDVHVRVGRARRAPRALALPRPRADGADARSTRACSDR